jgi:4-amino-4-deoxy-L-arabinose transferase-like glycosyltransferase
MPSVPDSPAGRPRRISLPLLLGFGAVAAARLLTLPRSLWEGDEVLFVKGVLFFDPLHHQPHPPGYPLLIGLGKLGNLLLHDPFASLVALSVLSSLIGYLALVDAFRRMAPAGPVARETVAVVGATLFHLSPAMLVYGPLALSDPPALMFLSLALAAAARLREKSGESGALRPALAVGAAASAAVGCRPQLALAVLPMLAVALWPARPWGNGRQSAAFLAGLGAFAAVSLLWFVPLVLAVGGPAGLLPFLAKQAGLVTRYDAGTTRAGSRALWVAVRFLAHPWGPRWTSLPVLGLAAAGTLSLAAARRIGALPLAVLCGVDLAFALAVMNPFDAVRYALPSLLGVAFAAAVGAEALARRARVPAAVWPALGLFTVGFLAYTAPLLAARTSADSPPVQAARWIARSAPRNGVFLVDKELAPHTSYLLRELVLRLADPGLQAAGEWRPGTPVFLLCDEESGWPGAVTFRWHDSDAYDNLTRGKLRTVSVSPIPGERRYTAVRGVEAFEPDACAPAYRWLGPDAAIRLNVAGVPATHSGTVAVTFGLPRYAPSPSVPVTVAVDGAAPRVVDVPRGGSRTLILPLPAGVETDEVTFRTPVSFVPAERGMGGDRRRLAVQLLGVERHAS